MVHFYTSQLKKHLDKIQKEMSHSWQCRNDNVIRLSVMVLWESIQQQINASY